MEIETDHLGLEEGGSNKKSVVDYSMKTLRSEMFDMVLLDYVGKSQSEASRCPRSGNSEGLGGGKIQSNSEDVNLRALLIHCAQAVSSGDHRSAKELLKQIRQDASHFGDGTQRLAHCFADGLEARMAGTGSETYCSMVGKPVSATDILRAYQLYMAACPFKKISYFFSNWMILKTVEKASALHIIDIGIDFGFQWPSFFQRISCRPGGPPKIRITGIEIPQPSFRSTEKLEETGFRLAEYARCFNIPFEYDTIAGHPEIRDEHLKINDNEMLIVNSLFHLKNLANVTMDADCPKNKLLDMIKKLNPAIFIHGIVNVSYSDPLFFSRFEKALTHFSALYDILDNTTNRDDPQRLVLEKEMFMRDALNVIVCEASSWVERPESYHQWQVRNLSAGLVQHPLDRDIVMKAIERVKSFYHWDFVIEEDSGWLVQGWKGHILYALSAWRPNNF